MPEENNTSTIIVSSNNTEDLDDGRETMVLLKDVSMVFNMASEQLNSLKEYAIALAKRELAFKELRALDDISFEVKQGDVFGILGTNGSGKSTLMKIIAGVLRPTEGSCLVNGNIAPLIELGAGFDFELTARENIFLNGALLGYSKSFISEHFDEIVEFAEIEQFLDMPMKNYSSGMVARIAFAIATVIIPEILIVDEVLSVGDFMFQQKCERRIMSLIKDYGVTVLIVSHNNDQIERLCNKAIWIEKGHTRILGDAHDVCRIYRVLGGHSGSQESENIVLKALEDTTDIPNNYIQTIAGDTLYGTAVRLAEASPKSLKGDYVILAPGEIPSYCLIANCLAAAFGCPILLTKQDSLPDVTMQMLKHAPQSKLVVLGNEDAIASSVVDAVKAQLKNETQIFRISENLPEAMALSAIKFTLEQNRTWGKSAILTYDGCTGDMLSLLPYINSAKAPILFNNSAFVIPDEVKDYILHSGITDLIVLAGPVQVPDGQLDVFREQGIDIVRFCGKDAYEANEMINNWMFEQGNDSIIQPQKKMNIVISSIWNPSDALASGPFIREQNAFMLLEDPQNLDSVAHAINYVEDLSLEVDHLFFLGDEMRFNDLDKTLLGKAAAKRSSK